MLLDAAITSSRRWVIKIMAIPLSEIFFITEISWAASLSVRTAVGSSNTRSFTPVLSISLAISINCIYPTGIPWTSVFSSKFIPTSSRALRASKAIAFISRLSRFFPRRRLTGLGFVISRFNLMFSVIVNPGRSINSWWTIPMPFSMAS